MGFRLILAGLIFFFNPCINIVDFLPDVIGAVLIAVGLNKLSDVEDRFYDARKYARVMIAVYALKAVLSLYIPARWQDGLLPVTFLFSVGEILLFLLFFTSLFGGIEYAANLHGGDVHLKKVGDVSRFCVLFSVVKCALAFLPESFALFPDPEPDYSYNAARIFTLSDAKPYAVLLCFVATLALGVFYLVQIVNFFRGLSRDTAFCENLFSLYRERVLENPHLMARRKFRRFFLLLSLGVVLLLDLTIDAVNLTPDFLAYFLFFAAVWSLSRDKRLLTLLVPLCATSFVRTIFQCLCDACVNRIMEYESYLSIDFAPLYNGSAVFILGALCFAEGVLWFFFMRRALSVTADEYQKACQKPFLTTGTLVFTALHATASLCAAVFPLCKAYFYHVYVNDTLVFAGYDRLSEAFETAQGFSVIAVLLLTAGFILYLVSLSRKADMELAPPEYR